jgi:hypothetical protein
LEKAIEQMRVTSEALLATQRELHSLTTLLDTMQHEVELLSHELVRLRDGYVYTLGILVVFRDAIAGLQEQKKMNLVGSFAS